MHNGALPANWRGLRGQAALGSFRQADAVKALRLRRPKAEGRESAFPEGRFETEAYAMHNGALPANRRGLRGQAALGSFRQADAVKALRLRRLKARERNQRLLRKVRDRSICHAQRRFAREPGRLARAGGLGELSTGCDAVKALRLRRPKAEGWESAFPEGRFETEAYAMHNGALPANWRGLRGQAALGSFRQAVTR